MKRFLSLFFFSVLLSSCSKKTDLETIYNCSSKSYSNLETVTDVKNVFSISIPKNWKTNLYFDTSQTSIYSADTTKQLTETTLIDATLIYKPVNFTKEFKDKISLKEKLHQLTIVTSKEINLIEKPSYLVISKGKKQGYSYQKSTVHIKINDSNFLVVKVEIYGDSLVNQRFCKAFKLIDKIQLK